jgi:hypothetical protein
MRRTIALPLLLAVLSTPCQAAIYKWVDEKGVTHYTEQPPASGKGQEIQPRVTTPATPAAPPAGQPAEKHAAATEQTPPREVMTMPAEKMAEQCQNARQRLQQLEASPRILIKGPDGEMQRAPEEERQRMIDEERKRIQLYCE